MALSLKLFHSLFLKKLDDYFFLFGRKAVVISGKRELGRDAATLCKESTPLLKTALKIATYCTILIPILVLAIKAVLRAIHRFYLIDPQKELEKGISIAPATLAKIQELVPKIIKGQKDDAIKWHANRETIWSLASLNSPTWSLKWLSPTVNFAQGALVERQTVD